MQKLKELLEEYGLGWKGAFVESFYESMEEMTKEVVIETIEKNETYTLEQKFHLMPFEEFGKMFYISNVEQVCKKDENLDILKKVPAKIIKNIKFELEMDGEDNLQVITTMDYFGKREMLMDKENKYVDFFESLRENRTKENKIKALFDEAADFEIKKYELNTFLVDLVEKIEMSYAMNEFIKKYQNVMNRMIEETMKNVEEVR